MRGEARMGVVMVVRGRRARKRWEWRGRCMIGDLILKDEDIEGKRKISSSC
jgi:hypothetical protein